MPKCELCMDEHGEPNLIKITGSTGWCKVHECSRKINDGCLVTEIANKDYWGER